MGLSPSTRNHSQPWNRSGALTPFSQFWIVFLDTPRLRAMYSCDFCESARDCHQILENRLTLSILASSVILPYLLITYIHSQYLNKWAVFLLPVFCAHREIIFFHLSKKKQQTKKAPLCGFLQEPKWNLQFFKKEALTIPDKIRWQEYDNFVSILPTIIIFVNGGV